ncbi:MAG TPA: Mu transposase C-terminal domain-containing protein [Candidatus Tumulicola sp.]|jgi:putative transposase
MVKGHRYLVISYIDVESVLAEDPQTGKCQRLFIADMLPVRSESTEKSDDVELALVNDADWQEAQRRFSYVQQILTETGRRRADVERVAAGAGVHVTTMYRWIADYESVGKISGLLPHKPTGGRGKSRLESAVEAILTATIDDTYLQEQQPSIQATTKTVMQRCATAGIQAPHLTTVRRRILTITEEVRLRRRANKKKAADRFEPRPGRFAAEWPLQIVQIDHTKVDIECVDEISRRPLGRPWLTLAIDVYSRMVTGFYLSLDPPGDAAVGLCLVNSILQKDVYLAGLGLSTTWRCWGIPHTVHADNGREFHSKMLHRCAQEYGFNLEFRPVKVPHFGAHIERLMGTVAIELKNWLGATFSNPKQKAEYDSGQKAVFTVTELEKSIAEFFTGSYHQRLHTSIKASPADRYEHGFRGDASKPAIGLPRKVVDEDKFRLDFMPFVQRTVQPYGVVADDIHYYHDVLRPYIHSTGKERNRKYLFRRDPRDISVLYFFDPELKHYCAIPYRNSAFPAISIWELREARAALLREGRASVDEGALMESAVRLRSYQDEAAKETRTVRRNRQRRLEHARISKPRVTDTDTSPLAQKIDYSKIRPFEDLRET